MEESELGLLANQCINRRIPNKETLIKEVAAWQNNRNKFHVKTDGQFKTDDAGVKLKRLYPRFQRLAPLERFPISLHRNRPRRRNLRIRSA